MTDLSDVTFCIGSPEGKRFYFRKNVSGEFAYADNDEVFASITENGKTFFIVAKPPYAEITAAEYVRCNRAVVSPGKFDFGELRRFLWNSGRTIITGNACVKNLSVFACRAMQCYTLITEQTLTVAVNFDGTAYSKDNRRLLYRFLSFISQKYRVFAAVTDSRFLPENCRVRRFSHDGEFSELSLKAESEVMRGARTARKYALKRGIGVKSKDIKKVVVTV